MIQHLAGCFAAAGSYLFQFGVDSVRSPRTHLVSTGSARSDQEVFGRGLCVCSLDSRDYSKLYKSRLTALTPAPGWDVFMDWGRSTLRNFASGWLTDGF